MSYYNKTRPQILLEQDFTKFLIRNYDSYDPIFSIIKNLEDCPFTEMNRDKIETTLFYKKFRFSNRIYELPTKTLTYFLEEDEKKQETNKYKYYIATFEDKKFENFKICAIYLKNKSLITFKNVYLRRHEITAENISFVVYQRTDRDTGVNYQEGSEWFQSAKSYKDLNGFCIQQKRKILEESSIKLKLAIFFKFRHDFLQTYIATRFGLTDHTEDKLDLKFLESKQTPDFLEFDENQNRALIGDVSVTTNYIGGLLNKQNKYRNLEINLKDKGKSVITLYSIIDPRLKNISTVFRDFNLAVINENSKDLDLWYEIQSIFDKLKEDAGVNYKNLVKELFEKEEILEEKIDERLEQELKISLDHFTNQNMVNKVKQNLNNDEFKENDFLEYIKFNLDSISTKEISPLSSKYKDKLMDEKLIAKIFAEVSEKKQNVSK